MGIKLDLSQCHNLILLHVIRLPEVDLWGEGVEAKVKIETNYEYYSRNEGKLSGQLPHWNFSFASICAVNVLNYNQRQNC